MSFIIKSLSIIDALLATAFLDDIQRQTIERLF
jgi:hypothetical protein